jgi:hypothetical protein
MGRVWDPVRARTCRACHHASRMSKYARALLTVHRLHPKWPTHDHFLNSGLRHITSFPLFNTTFTASFNFSLIVRINTEAAIPWVRLLLFCFVEILLLDGVGNYKVPVHIGERCIRRRVELIIKRRVLPPTFVALAPSRRPLAFQY